ncbi:MAG: GerAB/ArcD/ProY family transporter [Bacillota bacterium]
MGITAEKSKIGMAELVVLLTVSGMARIFLSFPRSIIEISGPAAWLSSLTGLVITLIQVYIFYIIIKSQPSKNIVEISMDNLGSIGGTVVNLLFAAFFISVAALFTRTFSEALITTALPRTPISVISTGYILIGVLGAYVGLEAMARSSRITYPFVLLGIALLLLGLAPRWDYTQLFPLLGNGPLKVFGTGGVIAGIVTEVLLASVIVKSFHGPEMFRKITLRAMMMGFAYFTILLMVLLLTFGWNVAQEHTMPFYMVSRLIYFGRFFQRVEAIFIIIWGYIGMVKVALTLYAAAVTIAGTLKLPDHRPLVFPLALIIFVVSLLPPDMTTAIRLESTLIRHIGLIPTMLLPIVILAANLIRKRMRKNEGG